LTFEHTCPSAFLAVLGERKLHRWLSRGWPAGWDRDAGGVRAADAGSVTDDDCEMIGAVFMIEARIALLWLPSMKE